MAVVNPVYKAECEGYLRGQGSYLARSRRYDQVRQWLEANGFEQGDLVRDLGAGMCDFAAYMYTCGHHFRYMPVDGSIDGTDLNTWVGHVTPYDCDWDVCIETIEHLEQPYDFLWALKACVGKGIILTTPNPERTDVLALDPTHKHAIEPIVLQEMGFSVYRTTIHYEEDTLVASYKAF